MIIDNEKETINEITEVCYAQLLSYKDEPMIPYVYIDEKTKSLDYISDNFPIITEAEAKEKIRQWVSELIMADKPVFLYTCRDNALISLEYPSNMTELEQCLRTCELQHLKSDPLGTVFWIGFD